MKKKNKIDKKTEIYNRILRIEAQKGKNHKCDKKCRKAGHKYYHDFKKKASVYGLSDGSLLIK